MSVVIAAAFPDFGYLSSDSRITVKSARGIFKRDVLQKTYQVGPHLAIGFTSNDVRISCLIIQALTNYSYRKAKSQNTLYLLDKLPRVARHEYERLTASMTEKPAMSFSFVGLMRDRATFLDSGYVFEMIKQHTGSFTLSPEMQRALFSGKDGKLYFPSPNPAVLVQTFPDSKILWFHTLGVSIEGSGSAAFDDELKSEMGKILLIPEPSFRIAILQQAIEDKCKKYGIDTVGGMNQTLILNESGVIPQGYSGGMTFDTEGNEVDKGRKIEIGPEGWVQTDLNTGKQVRILQQPMFIAEDEKFARLAGARA